MARDDGEPRDIPYDAVCDPDDRRGERPRAQGSTVEHHGVPITRAFELELADQPERIGFLVERPEGKGDAGGIRLGRAYPANVRRIVRQVVGELCIRKLLAVKRIPLSEARRFCLAVSV